MRADTRDELPLPGHLHVALIACRCDTAFKEFFHVIRTDIQADLTLSCVSDLRRYSYDNQTFCGLRRSSEGVRALSDNILIFDPIGELMVEEISETAPKLLSHASAHGESRVILRGERRYVDCHSDTLK